MNIKSIAAAAAIGAGVIIAKAAPVALGWAGGYALVHNVVNPMVYGNRHDQLIKALPTMKSNLPQKVDADTTLVDIRIDGDRVIYTYDLDFVPMDNAFVGFKDDLIKRVCANRTMRQSIVDKGGLYTYEYRANGRIVDAINVDACTPPA